MMNNNISWVWMLLLFLGFAFYNLSASQARPISSHHPNAIVVGTVFCNACFQKDLSKAISGAIVAVECANSGKRSGFYQEVKTNKHGKFSVHLPFMVNKNVNHITGCSVSLISSGEPHCAVASTSSASSSFRLHSRKKGTHIFSAGFFNLLCNQKPSIHSTSNKKEALYDPHESLTSSTPNDHTFSPTMSSFLTIKQEFLPPLPRLPPLPELPPLPPLPLLPPFFRSPPMSPPSIFPPFYQSPPMSPPSIFPPIFRSPPIFPPIFPPSIVGLTPPPIPRLTPLPPPPPPTFTFPLFPPFPFRPMPGFPGVPPSPDKKNSP
ncbi:leucine-rich repeat extensin-like protein 1 [Lycium ferocissimum]|uniref:leucine-rich repeat extensin-like protein 1 n=1 Tax=Lycium ferocissimum TaxID=112874 RepID=UPI00281618C8|nr:leucine-rich repeat extensin-like protein 1 [Lycium ferocissimum]